MFIKFLIEYYCVNLVLSETPSDSLSPYSSTHITTLYNALHNNQPYKLTLHCHSIKGHDFGRKAMMALIKTDSVFQLLLKFHVTVTINL